MMSEYVMNVLCTAGLIAEDNAAVAAAQDKAEEAEHWRKLREEVAAAIGKLREPEAKGDGDAVRKFCDDERCV